MARRRPALALALVAALLGPAGASTQSAPPAAVTATTFVITGRGWGHGVGMSQWGAYGYARNGVSYDRILAHFYPGTKLVVAGSAKVNVLLIEQARKVVVSSPDPFAVQDGTGVRHDLAAGNYALDSSLTIRSDPDGPGTALPGPLTFLPGKSPLWLAHPYRGAFVVSATGPSLSVVNSVPLDAYARGVVSSEMPHDWPLEAVKAQAVAARSYALAHRRGGTFDVYADTRDQVYGGIAAETPVGDQAVAGTARQVLTYRGKVATTYYFASSGGRTAAVKDAFASAKPTPYLVPVRDPYDTLSPYHTWGPIAVPAAAASRALHIRGVSDLRPVPASGRARSVVVSGAAGESTVSAPELRQALGLRSTWIKVGVLSLSRPSGTVTAGTPVALTGRATGVASTTLEQRIAGGDWQPGPALSLRADGTFALSVTATVTTQYRLVAGPTRSAILRVVVG